MYRNHPSILTTLLLACMVLVLCCMCAVRAQCYHPIYCRGPVLETLQSAQLFSDGKTFVDLPLRVPPSAVISAFNSLPPNPTNATLLAFLNTFFFPVDSDLISLTPTDWDPIPPLFLNISYDPRVRELASFINEKWLHLVRMFNDSFCDGCYSHISVPYPFVIAGSRFREFYYWDTYWAVDGLLLSNMSLTAYGIVRNFLGLVQKFGFVPNGGRIYYLDRSQPPMLTQIVKLYLEANPNDTATLLEEALPILDTEYKYWMTTQAVNMGGIVLNRYVVNNTYPRPESYYNDVTLAQNLTQSGKEHLYQELATAAESGWDFSTRWMKNAPDITTLQTTDILPVDLNSIMYANELVLADFHKRVGDISMSTQYLNAAQKRLSGIQKYMWNETTLSWQDFNYVQGIQTSGFYASTFVPYWAGVYKALDVSTLSEALQHWTKVFAYPAGVPTSVFNSGQQWDFPNGWAPLQYFIVQGFLRIANDPAYNNNTFIAEEVRAMAKELVDEWITTNYCAYKKYGMMFEKYDVTAVGSAGSGGEYTVQDGFGWTNGVALRFIYEAGNELSMGECPPS